MPTTRPRVLVTETEEVEAALAVAARVWPEEPSRSRLLARLAVVGAAHLPDPDADARRDRRLAVLERRAGRFAGLFPLDCRERLRDEWPA